MDVRECQQLLESCTAALQANPNQLEVLLRRGMARHLLGDFAGAAADCTQALELWPECAEAHNNRGVTREKLGDRAGALADYDRAIQLKPDYAEAYNNRGVIRAAQGEVVGAAADFDAALRLKPFYPEAYNNRGAARQAQGDLPGALADFDAALRLNANYAEAYDNRAGVHYLMWHHAAAVADFNRAIALYRQSTNDRRLFARLHVHRGDARYHDGDGRGLVSDYREAARQDPQFGAQIFIERLACDIQCNLALVLANCEKHLREDPDDFIALALARRGLVRFLLGEDAAAEVDLVRFRGIAPDLTGILELGLSAATRYRQEHGPVVPGRRDGASGAWARTEG
jgi:tetratricopeptide (TPR) repeat protein